MEKIGKYFKFGHADVFRAPEIIHGLFAVLEKKGAKILLLLFGEACIEVVNQIDVKHNLQILFLYVNMF